MKKLALCLLLTSTLGTPPAVFADNQATRESVETLLELMDADAVMDTIYGQVGGMFKQAISVVDPTPDEMKIIEKYSLKLEELMKTEMGWNAFKEPMVDVYVRHFSQQEINGVIEFYKTDIGQSMVKKLPQIMAEVMPMTMGIVEQQMPNISAIAKEMAEELKALETAAE